jgi:hypothetical protein
MSDPDQNATSTEQKLEIDKLKLEIEELKRSHEWNRRGGKVLSVVSALLPALALLVAFKQFSQQQMAQTSANQAASERAFMQPVLGRQMNLYFETSEAAATLASSQDLVERAKARDSFLRLYLGPLPMIESPDVSLAMKNFRACLDLPRGCPPRELEDLSLALASSLQSDFFASWNLGPQEYAKRSINYAEILRSRK